MAELTEDTEIALAAELLAGWYNDGDKAGALISARKFPQDSAALVAAARKLATQGKLGPVAQPEPETWEPTMRLRWYQKPYPGSGCWEIGVPTLQQLWRSSAGAEEWRDVEAGQ